MCVWPQFCLHFISLIFWNGIVFYLSNRGSACQTAIYQSPGFWYLKPSLSQLQALIRAGLSLGLNGLGSVGSGLEAQPSTSLHIFMLPCHSALPNCLFLLHIGCTSSLAICLLSMYTCRPIPTSGPVDCTLDLFHLFPPKNLLPFLLFYCLFLSGGWFLKNLVLGRLGTMEVNSRKVDEWPYWPHPTTHTGPLSPSHFINYSF